jgi:broad specificity phosphatase PhoE
MKTLFIVRHVESLFNIKLCSHLNADISPNGEYQGGKLAHLMSGFDLSYFVGYTSPMLRCLKTAKRIQDKTGLQFVVKPELCEVSWTFPDDGLHIEKKSAEFPEMDWSCCGEDDMLLLPKEDDSVFVAKHNAFLSGLPRRAVVVTHGTCVQTLSALSIGEKLDKAPEWDNSIKNASLTMIFDGRLHFSSKWYIDDHGFSQLSI